jgi:hypothetical protein
MIGFTTILERTGVRQPPGRPIGTCVVCRRSVAHDQENLRVRGLLVHWRCATYRMRRDRVHDAQPL